MGHVLLLKQVQEIWGAIFNFKCAQLSLGHQVCVELGKGGLCQSLVENLVDEAGQCLGLLALVDLLDDLRSSGNVYIMISAKSKVTAQCYVYTCSTSPTWSVIFSKFCGVILFSMDFSAFCAFSSSGSSVTVPPIL